MSITATIAATRTSGTAPLAVTFNGLSSDSSLTADEWRDCEHFWNFGDSAGSPVSGLYWDYGARAGVSLRNEAYGPVAAHVFENAGTFEVTYRVTDGVDFDTDTITITVTDADTTYSGTNTICYSNDSDFTGAPSGATQTQTSSFDTIRAAILAGRRLLLKRGDTFTASNSNTIGANGPWQVGAFGTGANPIIQVTADNVIACPGPAASGSTQRNNVTWMDLQVDPNSHSGVFVGRHTDTPFPNTSFDQLLYLRINTVDTVADGIYSFAAEENYIVDCDFDVSFYGVFWYDLLTAQDIFEDSAILGSRIYNNPALTDSGHTLRLIHHQRTVISYNELGGGQIAQHIIKMAGAEEWDTTDGDYTDWSVISENKIVDGGGSSWCVTLTPVNSSTDYRQRRFIVERNWFVGGGANSQYVSIHAYRGVVRNNVFDMTVMNTAGDNIGVNIWTRNTGQPDSDDIQVYNNSFYSGHSAAATAFIHRMIRTTDTATNVIVRNNLGYTPNANDSVMVTDAGAGTGYTVSNNSSDAQVRATDPSFVTQPPTQPSHFALQSGSYGRDAGVEVPVFDTMDLKYRNQTDNLYDLGAFDFEGGQFPWETTRRFYSMGYARTLV